MVKSLQEVGINIMTGDSWLETKPFFVRSFIKTMPKTVLDVGAGQGIYLNYILAITDPGDVIVDAVEVWEPYVEMFNLKERYNKVIIDDVRNLDNFNYDFVIFGDVLEHMSEEDAIAVWNKAKSQARNAFIAIPTIHFPQDEMSGNPYEKHVVEDWNVDRVIEKFEGITSFKNYSGTGAFLAEFSNA